VLPIAIFVGLWQGSIFTQADTENYLSLATGDVRHAMLPFASRQLGPLVVRGLVNLLHVTIKTGFFIEGIASMIFFIGTVLFLLARSGAPRMMIPAVAGLSFWAQQFNGLVMPDLFYAALLCVFLLLIHRHHILAASLMMFPLALSRESTMLTLVCFLIAGWRRLRASEVFASLLATACGLIIAKHLAAHALPNKENITPMFYMAAKMPWNFLKNILGLKIWANVYQSCEVPKLIIPLHLGPLRKIGLCGFNAQLPVTMLSYGFASFGLLPLLLLKVRNVRLPSDSNRDLLLKFSVLYGGLSFILAPLLGEAFVRLFGYGWPLFLVALPILLGATRYPFSSGKTALIFLGLHLLLSWSMIFILSPVTLLAISVALYAAGWIVLRQSRHTFEYHAWGKRF